MKRFFSASYFAIIMLFIYIPIAIVIVFSFNSGESVFSWSGFSTKWYESFFNNSPFVKSIVTSLFVAIVSTTISVLIGVLAAVGLSKLHVFTRSSWLSVANIPLINADVITAVSLMIVFIIAGMKFGIVTLIMAHVSFNVPYVLITVMPRIKSVDKNLINASLDLGASKIETFFRIVLPILRPAIITATAIAFAMSFDDFIISYFTGGGETNVSTFIYSAKKIKPYVFAFGTVLVAVIALAIIIWNLITAISAKKQDIEQQIRDGRYKSRQVAFLTREIIKLYDIINKKSRLRITKKISLILKYYWLKTKIYFVNLRNYDKRISKLEWKIYRLNDEIKYEKRLRLNHIKSQKRLEQLRTLVKTNQKKHRNERILKALAKLEQKVIQQQEEIKWYDDRQTHDNERILSIEQEINELIQYCNDQEISKTKINYYQKRIKKLEIKKAIYTEGKMKYNLRSSISRLSELKNRSYNELSKLNNSLKDLQQKVFIQEPLLNKLNKKIVKLQKLDNLSNYQAQKLEMYQNTYNELIEQKLEMYRWKLIKREEQLNALNLKIETKTSALTNPDNINNKPRTWISKGWKTISASVVFVAAFSGLTVAYVQNNIYDLIIANWGEYIDITLIKEFEQEYNVKVNYQEYDSNETLYNKLYTINYDLMIPSDYMVQKLASENRLESLDTTKLDVWGEGGYYNENATDNPKMEIDSGLLKVLSNSKVGDGSQTLTDFAVPYFWGDLVIAINTDHSDVVNWLTQTQQISYDENFEITSSELSWDILNQAANAGFDVVLNNDAKNIFQIGLQVLYGKENAQSQSDIDAAGQYVENLITKNNVLLQGDDIMTTVGTGNFDIAMMYNGDVAYSNQVYNKEDDDNPNNDGNTRFIYGRPGAMAANGKEQGTNIFSDNMVISKDSNHKDLAYDFINFIYEHATQNSSYVGSPSPSKDAEYQLTDSNSVEWGDYADYKELYLPSSRGEAFQFDEDLDNYLNDLYNSLIAGKN